MNPSKNPTWPPFCSLQGHRLEAGSGTNYVRHLRSGGQGGAEAPPSKGGSVSGGNETVLFWGQSPPRRVDLQTIKSNNIVPGPFGDPDHHQRLGGILKRYQRRITFIGLTLVT